MKDMLRFLQIYGLAISAQIWFNFFNFEVIYSRIKFGNYKLPFCDHVFKSLASFTVAGWLFNSIFCYPWATVLTTYSFVLSIKYFNGLSTGLIVTVIANLMNYVFFMRLTAGETFNRSGWIAVILIIIASFFAAHSGKNI